jgi:hypothetical protein
VWHKTSYQLSDLAHTTDSRPLRRLMSSTRTALCLREGLSYDEWAQVGRSVQRVNEASAWWVGDWLIYGRDAFGDRYRKAIDATGFDYQTLRNYAWVAARFELSRRRDKLSFGHHAEVASLEAEEQDGWLDRASVHGWSRNELRRRIRAEAERPAGQAVTVVLAVPATSHSRWAAAASVEGRGFAEWAQAALDAAAESALAEPVRHAAA